MAYEEPVALVVVSSVSLGIAAVAILWIATDILRRRGWRSMMGIMIPLYLINASYIYPITLWVYYKYGRPQKPQSADDSNSANGSGNGHSHAEHEGSSPVANEGRRREAQPENGHAGVKHDNSAGNHHGSMSAESKPPTHGMEHGDMGGHQHHHHTNVNRPMFATVTVGVCHCGAGCTLGDIVGEWLLYGVHGKIAGRALYAAYLMDFAWALAFGIIFQYFSIAPMAGEYGPKTLWRAAEADFLSLLFFQVGLYSWMTIYQIAIWNWKLEITTVTYWCMMQVGMFCGHWTAVPINYWLISSGIKEPCV